MNLLVLENFKFKFLIELLIYLLVLILLIKMMIDIEQIRLKVLQLHYY